MEPVSIGLLVAYVIIIAIALERSYRVHSLKLKYAASNKNMEDLAYARRVFIITTLRKYGVRCWCGYGGDWHVSGEGLNRLVLLDECNFYFNLIFVDGVLKASCARIPYAEISEDALTVLCTQYADTYNNWVKALCKNKTAKRNVTAKLASAKPVKCKIKNLVPAGGWDVTSASTIEDMRKPKKITSGKVSVGQKEVSARTSESRSSRGVGASPESTTSKASAKKKTTKCKAVKVSTKPVKVKIKK